MVQSVSPSPLPCYGGCGRLTVLGHGAQAEWGPSPLTSHLPLVSGVPDPGQRTPLSSVPAPLQDPSRNPSAELSGTPLGCLKTLGGARRATGPGSSVLLCHFIEERWCGGESTSAAAGEHTQPLGCPAGPGHWVLHRAGSGGGWLAFCTTG